MAKRITAWYPTRQKRLVTDHSINDFEPAAFAGMHTPGQFALQLSVHAHITLNGFTINKLGNMVPAGIHAFPTTHAFLCVHYRHAEKMHLHGTGWAHPDTGEIPAGSAVDEFIHASPKSTHGNAVMFFPAYSHAGGTSPTRFFILFNIHGSSPWKGRVNNYRDGSYHRCLYIVSTSGTREKSINIEHKKQ